MHLIFNVAKNSFAYTNMSRSAFRTIKMLELLADRPDGSTLSDLARRLNAPKASIVPVIRMLVEEGYIAKNELGRYLNEPKLLEVALGSPLAVRDRQWLIPRVISLLIERVRRAFKAEGVSVLLWDEVEQLLRPTYSFSLAAHQSVPLKSGEGIAGRVWQFKKPILVPDYMVWEHALPGFRTSEWRSHMAVLLRSDEMEIGVLVVRSHSEKLKFSERDLQQLVEISTHAQALLSGRAGRNL